VLEFGAARQQGRASFQPPASGLPPLRGQRCGAQCAACGPASGLTGRGFRAGAVGIAEDDVFMSVLLQVRIKLALTLTH